MKRSDPSYSFNLSWFKIFSVETVFKLDELSFIKSKLKSREGRKPKQNWALRYRR